MDTVPVILLLYTFTCAAESTEFSLINGEGFTVRSLNPPGYFKDTDNFNQRQFYFYSYNTASQVRAVFGNVTGEANIGSVLSNIGDRDPLHLNVIQLENVVNVTAHIVEDTVTNVRPSLQVLIHADWPLQNAHCARVYAHKSPDEGIDGHCTLWKDENGRDYNVPVCLVDITLPYEWWSSRTIDVYYNILPIEACTNASNEARRSSDSIHTSVQHVGEVFLVFDDQYTAKEVIENEFFVFSLPDKSVEPGSNFAVTIKLIPGKALDSFTIRLDLPDGLSLTSVKSADHSAWKVSLNSKSNHMAYMNIASTSAYPKQTLKTQELVVFQFEVSKSLITLDAYIRWSLEVFASNETIKLPHTLSVVTDIAISKLDEIAHLIGVVKKREIISLHWLTGNVFTMPIWFYTIDRFGRVSKANSRVRCSSTQDKTLKVSKLCDSLFISGKGGDPGIVTINAVISGIRASTNVRVWYPDDVIIEASDEKLNKIKGWNKLEQDGSSPPKCSHQIQPADVKVYCIFYTVHKRQIVLLEELGKTTMYSDITSLVGNRLSISNRDVLQYEDGRLNGLQRGKAHLRVNISEIITQRKRTVRVSWTKVGVEKILANFVSDVEMRIAETEDSGVLTARFNYDKTLSNKHQEGTLKLSVQFTDKNVIPLSAFDNSSYHLEITNETPDILAVKSTTYNNFITVRGLSKGTGSLNIELRSVDCDTRMPTILAVHTVKIESTVEQRHANTYYNDAAYKPGEDSRVHNDAPDAGRKLSKAFGNVKSVDSLTGVSLTASSKSNPNKGVTALETGMFVMMGVVAVVASVFVTNCLIYVVNQRKQKVGKKETATKETVSNGWVWLNKNTLEENAISTKPDQLVSERDFVSIQKSATNSLSSSHLKRSSVGTYQGSECNIQITCNPHDQMYDYLLKKARLSRSSSGSSHTTNIIVEPISPVLSSRGDLIGVEEEECFGDDTSYDESDSLSLDISPDITQEQFDNLKETVA